MTEATLSEPAQVSADASGTATVSIGPKRPGEVWAVSRVFCTSSPSTTATAPVATVYQGTAGGTRLGATGRANAVGDAIGPSCYLFPGQQITVVFTGCDPGATARIDVSGRKTLPA